MVIICAKHDVHENENYYRVLVGLGCITILRIIRWMESTAHTNLTQGVVLFLSSCSRSFPQNAQTDL